MIAASRRRLPGVPSADETFRLHLRMARRASLAKRLMRGSVLALVASLIALFAGAEIAAHLAACGVGFLAGLALPVPGTRGAALADIRAVAGLSYETALDQLEHGAAGGEADPYGFRSAVVDRARLSVRDLRPTSPPAWWLPALAVALALVLFAALERPFAVGGRGGGATGGPSGGSEAPFVPGSDPQTAVEEPEAERPEPEPERAGEPADAGGQERDDAADSAAPAPPTEFGDAAPLSRFLDSLRERPPESQPPEPGQGGGQRAGRESGALGDPADAAGDRGAQTDGEPQRAELRSGEPAEGDSQEAGQVEGQEQGDQGAGADSSGQEQGGAGEEEGVQGAEGEDGEEAAGGASEEGGEGQAPVANGGAEPDEALGGAGADGADGQASEFQDAGGAGAAGGPESAAGVADAGQAPPEFLEGVLEAGPENPAGTVRLPGSDEVALPPGRSVTEYQSAAEEALTEGDLPLSYQEIIRRYFR